MKRVTTEQNMGYCEDIVSAVFPSFDLSIVLHEYFALN